jgi:hypothetical protein
MLRRGDETHELVPLLRALERCIGADVLEHYDRWIDDDEIPGAPFLWYQREEAIGRIADSYSATRSFPEIVDNIAWS